MRYLVGVIVPVLLQSLFVFIVIEMNAGNGSWLGLGAFLLGIFAIPATALVNIIYIKSNKEAAAFSVVARCFLMTLIVPFIILFLFVLG